MRKGQAGRSSALRAKYLAVAVAAAFAPWTAHGQTPPPANQMPNVTVTAGTANVNAPVGTFLNIDQASQRAIYEGSLTMGANAHMNLQHTFGRSGVGLFRDVSGSQSQIFGRITSNGQVFISNQNGVLFGSSARIEVGGLFATSLSINDTDFMNGRYNWYNAGGAGSVINQGFIAAPTGYAALAGPQVRNDGIIQARMGSVVLAAGDRVSLDIIGDGLISVSVDQAALNASAINSGTIEADGGTVLLTARSANALLDTVVNAGGAIRATSLIERNGEIVLDGGNAGTVMVAGNHNAGSASVSGANVTMTGTIVTDIGSGTQTITTPGTLSIQAGGGSAQNAGLIHQGSGEQKVTAGNLVMAGGTGVNTTAVLTSADAAADQTIVAGALQVRGGSSGDANQAILRSAGNQVINASGTIVVEGGASSGPGGNNTAFIIGATSNAPGKKQTINAGSITVKSGAGGIQNGAVIVGSKQEITTTGDVLLAGGGTAGTLGGVRMGGLSTGAGGINTGTDLTLNVGNDLLLSGGVAPSNSANIGSTAGLPQTIRIDAGRDVIVGTSGTSAARIGLTPTTTADTVSVTAGRDVRVNGGGEIVSGGTVTVKATNGAIDVSATSPLAGNARISSGAGQDFQSKSIAITSQNGRLAQIINNGGEQAIKAGTIDIQTLGPVGGRAEISNNGLGAQKITVSGDHLTVKGLSTSSTATITGNGNQTIDMTRVGAKSITLGDNAAQGVSTITSNGEQKVLGYADITLTGGSGTANPGGSNALIQATNPTSTQRIEANNLSLSNSTLGGNNSVAAIMGAHQSIHALGNVTLTANASGGTLPGVRIGGLAANPVTGASATATELDLLIGGNLELKGGTAANNGVGIGSTAATGPAFANTITIDVGGNVILTSGTAEGTGARIGSSATTGNALGDIRITAGGTIALNGTAQPTAIRTLGNVTLEAASISEGSNGIVIADTLTTTTSGITNLAGPNEITRFNGTSGGTLTLIDSGALQVTGISTTNDVISLTADSLTNGGVISNGGGASTANVILNADAFNLADGTVEGGAAAVILRPRTGSNSFGIESAGTTTVSNADIASINTSNFVVFGSGTGTIFTGNMTIGQNAQVDGGAKNLAFFRSANPGGTTTIGANGVSTTGNLIISAGGGAIVSNGGTLAGDQVQLRASQGIGNAASRVQTAANRLAISNTGPQGAFVSERDDVTIGNVNLIVGGIVNNVANSTGGLSPYNVSANGVMTIGGNISTSNGLITLTAERLVNNAVITNSAGVPGNSITLLSANSFDLAGGQVNNGAGAIAVRPRSAGNSFGIEDASQATNITNADLASLNTTDFIVLGSGIGSNFTGNMSVGADRLVDVGGKKMAFFRSELAPGTIGIGAHGVSSTSDVIVGAGGGAIVSNGGTITGNQVLLRAAAGIGSAASRVRTDANSLGVTTGAPGAFIADAGDVTLRNLAISVGGNLNTGANAISGGGAYDLSANGLVTVVGPLTTSNGAITLTAGALNNAGGLISNGGTPSTANVILSADSFNLAGGLVAAGDGAVILRPRTGMNTFGIESAGQTTLTNADIASINTNNFVVFGSGIGTTFTGNMTIGQNARVEGGGKHLAFFRSSAPGGTTTIGAQGVNTSGNVIVSAGGGAIVSNGGTVSGDQVQLRASQGVGTSASRVQTSAGRLAVNTTGGSAFVTEANDVTLGGVDLRVGGNTNNFSNFVGNGGSYNVTANGALTVDGLVGTANGAINLIASSLANNGLITNGGGANTAVTLLSANAFDLDGGTVQNGAGVIAVRPRNPAASFGIEDAAQGTNLTNADLGRLLTTDFIVLGSGIGTNFTGNLSIGADRQVALGDKKVAFFRSDLAPGSINIGANGVATASDILIGAGSQGFISGNGAIMGERVALRAGGDIGSPFSRIATSASTLAAQSANGGVFLSEAGGVDLSTIAFSVGGIPNTVTNAAAGSYDLAAGGSITLTDRLQAGAVSLSSPGAIAETGAGAVVAGTLSTSSIGDTLLTGANEVATFSGSSAADLSLHNTGALTVTGLSAGGNATLDNVGNVTVTGPWTAGGTSRITAHSDLVLASLLTSANVVLEADGLITEFGTNGVGAVLANTLTTVSDGSTFFTGENRVANYSGSSGADLTFFNRGDLNVTGLNAGMASVSNEGAVTISGPWISSQANINSFGLGSSISESGGGFIQAASFNNSLSAQGSISLNGPNRISGTLFGSSQQGSFSLTNAGDLNFGASAFSGDVSLVNAGVLHVTSLNGRNVAVANTGPMTVSGSWISAGTTSISAAGAAGDLTVNTLVTSQGAMTVNVDRALTIAASGVQVLQPPPGGFPPPPPGSPPPPSSIPLVAGLSATGGQNITAKSVLVSAQDGAVAMINNQVTGDQTLTVSGGGLELRSSGAVATGPGSTAQIANLSTGTQTIRVSGGSGIDIRSSAGNSTITHSGSLGQSILVTGADHISLDGAGGSASISAVGAAQTVSITGSGANALRLGSNGATGSSLIVGRSQTVTAGAEGQNGSITIVGSSVNGRFAGLSTQPTTGGTQSVSTSGLLRVTGGNAPAQNLNAGLFHGGGGAQTVNAGRIELNGGSAGTNNGALIVSSGGGTQTVTTSGDIVMTGGTGGNNNAASIVSNTGAQTVTVGADLLLSGGAGGNAGISGPATRLQKVSARNIEITNSALGGNNSVGSILGGLQDIHATGDVKLTARNSGGELPGVRIGGLSGTGSTSTNLKLTVDGDLILTGGTGNNGVGIGTTGAPPAGAVLRNDITIEARDVILNGGTGAAAAVRIGASGAPGVPNFAGDIRITARDIKLNVDAPTGALPAAIRTLGNVTLDAASISEGANGLIVADRLTTTTTGATNLGGSNDIKRLQATSGGPLTLVDAGGLQVLGIATTNDTITLTTDSLTNSGVITNGGPTSTANIVFNANAFNLEGGTVEGGAAAVILRPRTGTNSFGIESVGQTTLTNADIASIHTSDFVVFGSGIGTTFTGNMFIGQNAQVDGGGKNLAFFRSSQPGGSTTIGIGGVSTTGNVIVSAGGGSIVSEGGTVAGDQVQLRASQGIGSTASGVRTDANALTINNLGTGGAFVSEANDVTLRDTALTVGGIANNASNFVSGNLEFSAGGDVSVASTVESSGTMNFNAAGALDIDALARDVALRSSGGQLVSAQSIGITAQNFWRASIENANGNQTVTAGDINLQVPGIFGAAQIVNSGFSGDQTVGASGQLIVLGGASGSAGNSGIFNDAFSGSQQVTAAGIILEGAPGGAFAGAGISTRGDQLIDVRGGDIHLRGGDNGFLNSAFISAGPDSQQTILARDINLSNGSGGTDTAAYIVGGHQLIEATGNVRLTAQSAQHVGFGPEGAGVRIGAPVFGSTGTDLTLRISGDLVLTGGSATQNNATIGSLGFGPVPPGQNAINIEAGGSVILTANPFAGSEARIGSGTGGGNIDIRAGAGIELNGRGARIATLNNISLDAATITESNNGSIVANTLATRSTGDTTLTGPNEIATFSGSAGGDLSLVNYGSLTVTGVNADGTALLTATNFGDLMLPGTVTARDVVLQGQFVWDRFGTGSIVADTLSVLGSDVYLPGANRVANFSADAGNLHFSNSGDLNVHSMNVFGFASLYNGGSVRLLGPWNSTFASIEAYGPGASITQDAASSLASSTLSTISAAGTRLDGQNQIAQYSGRSGGELVLNNSGPLDIAGMQAGADISLSNAGAVNVSGLISTPGILDVTTIGAGADFTVRNSVSSTGAMDLDIAGRMVVSADGPQSVSVSGREQTIRAGGIEVTSRNGGFAGILNNGGEQRISVTDGSIDVRTLSGNGSATIGSNAPGASQTILVSNGDHIAVNGASGFASIGTSGQQQISIIGSGNNAITLGSAGALGGSSVFGARQVVTAGAAGELGSINIVGGDTNGRSASFSTQALAGGTQNVTTSGLLSITGGAAPSQTSPAGIFHNGSGEQTVNAARIELQGGATGNNNPAFISSNGGFVLGNAGAQNINVSGDLVIAGGAGGNAGITGPATRLQTIRAHNIHMTNSAAGGFNSVGFILGGHQDIHAAGNLTMTARASGGDLPGVRIGGLAANAVTGTPATATDLKLTAGGDLVLTGGTAANNGVGIGSTAAPGPAFANDLTIDVGGNVILNAGSLPLTGARIGSSANTGAGAGDIRITAGGDIRLNGVDQGTAIRTQGDVTLQAATIIEAANGIIEASALTTRTTGDTLLGGLNRVNSFTASSDHGNVQLTNTSAVLSLGSMDLPGNLAIVQTGDVAVGNASATSGTLIAASGDISMSATGQILVRGSDTTIGAGAAILAGDNLSFVAGKVTLNTGDITLRAGDAALTPVVVRGANGVRMTVGNELNVTGGGGLLAPALLTSGSNVDLTIGGAVRIDAGSGYLSLARVQTEIRDGVISITFPNLTEGGYFVNGIEGDNHHGQTGFFADFKPAKVGSTLLLEYGN